MNIPIKPTFVAALLALAFIPSLRAAADDDTPPPPGRGEQAGPRIGPDGRRGERLKMLAEKLELTAEQKEKIRPILAEEAKALKAVRNDEALSRDERRAKFQEIVQAHRAQIRPVLTPEQQTKFDNLRHDMRRERRRNPRD